MAGPLGIQLGCRQEREGLFVLPEVGTGAGHDDTQFVGLVSGELGGLGAARQLDRPFGAPDAAFAIGDQWQ